MIYALERIRGSLYAPDVTTLPVATIGGNIRRLREAAGFKTQIALAEEMGIKSQTISDWEQNRRSELDLSSMFRLAKAVKCGLDDLVAGVDMDYDRLRSDPASHGVWQDAVAPRDRGEELDLLGLVVSFRPERGRTAG